MICRNKTILVGYIAISISSYSLTPNKFLLAVDDRPTYTDVDLLVQNRLQTFLSRILTTKSVVSGEPQVMKLPYGSLL